VLTVFAYVTCKHMHILFSWSYIGSRNRGLCYSLYMLILLQRIYRYIPPRVGYSCAFCLIENASLAATSLVCVGRGTHVGT